VSFPCNTTAFLNAGLSYANELEKEKVIMPGDYDVIELVDDRERTVQINIDNLAKKEQTTEQCTVTGVSVFDSDSISWDIYAIKADTTVDEMINRLGLPSKISVHYDKTNKNKNIADITLIYDLKANKTNALSNSISFTNSYDLSTNTVSTWNLYVTM
jgi:hypothetical protein